MNLAQGSGEVDLSRTRNVRDSHMTLNRGSRKLIGNNKLFG